MAIQQQVITLNSSTATLVSIPKAYQPAYEKTVSLNIQNLDESSSIFVGNSEVNSTDNFGYEVVPTGSVGFDISPSDEIWAISDSGTPQVAILSIGE
jgi:hypothetical protein